MLQLEASLSTCSSAHSGIGDLVIFISQRDSRDQNGHDAPVGKESKGSKTSFHRLIFQLGCDIEG